MLAQLLGKVLAPLVREVLAEFEREKIDLSLSNIYLYLDKINIVYLTVLNDKN